MGASISKSSASVAGDDQKPAMPHMDNLAQI